MLSKKDFSTETLQRSKFIKIFLLKLRNLSTFLAIHPKTATKIWCLIYSTQIHTIMDTCSFLGPKKIESILSIQPKNLKLVSITKKELESINIPGNLVIFKRCNRWTRKICYKVEKIDKKIISELSLSKLLKIFQRNRRLLWNKIYNLMTK